MTTESAPALPSTRATATKRRWFVAVLCIIYGFGKLNDSQFTVLDSELTRPMGEVSGFWLVWYFFGYSKFYGSILALVQIVGGLLLVWPRTALLAALMLVPVFTNIVLVDIFFVIDPSATLTAIVILGCLVSVILPHTKRLLAAVLQEDVPRGRAWRIGAMGATLLGAFAFTWWIANRNNRAPTAIDGVWAAVPDTTGNPLHSPMRWPRVFFERNRANMVVFRAADGTDALHHFDVDSAGTVRVWKTYRQHDSLLWQGAVNATGELVLRSPGGGAAAPAVYRRERGPR